MDFERQVLPGFFEFALCHLVDGGLDLSGLRERFRNDASGAPAFDPVVLLKLVLLGYSRGLVNSRSIAAACRHNVLFMAVSGDSCPHSPRLPISSPRWARNGPGFSPRCWWCATGWG